MNAPDMATPDKPLALDYSSTLIDADSTAQREVLDEE